MKEKNKITIDEVKKELSKIYLFEDTEYETIKNSSIFINYINSSQFYDLMNIYITYIINGTIQKKLKEIKKQENLDDNTIIEYINNILKKEYKSENPISIPSDYEMKMFLKSLFSQTKNYLVNTLSEKEKISIYFINDNLNNNFNYLSSKIDNLQNVMIKILELPYRPFDKQFDELRIRYNKSFKQIFQKCFLYGIGEVHFNKFYVQPDIIKRKEVNKLIISDDVTSFVEWNDIFCNSEIVYVVGGPGYGKSLFLRNIINNVEKINICNIKDYIIIYCDLKLYVTMEEYRKKTVIDFLQESMISITGIEITKQLIEYYLNQGRCLILLDAMDEVPKDLRNELHKKIVSYFQNGNPNNKICITSRSRGFFPCDNIETYEILPLSNENIDDYLEHMIQLQEFKKSDKKNFMDQAMILNKINFLNNFLILSLLINIYKAERELPENKIDLYNKCFVYIAKTREKEKTKIGYDWEIIGEMVIDSTFIRFSNLALPNNKDISRADVENSLSEQFSNRFTTENKKSEAIDLFLDFCSNRTDLFVPASTEDTFKFFHRSFFEYFYAKHLLQLDSIEEIFDLLKLFDFDSEVFELLIALLKKDNDKKYTKLVNYIIEQSIIEFKNIDLKCTAFNILTIIMQVADDAKFLKDYYEMIINNLEQIINYKFNFINNSLIAKWINLYLEKYEIRKNNYNELVEIYYAQWYYIFFSKYEKFIMRKLRTHNTNFTKDINNENYLIPFMFSLITPETEKDLRLIPFYALNYEYGYLYETLEKYSILSREKKIKLSTKIKKGIFCFNKFTDDEQIKLCEAFQYLYSSIPNL